MQHNCEQVPQLCGHEMADVRPVGDSSLCSLASPHCARQAHRQQRQPGPRRLPGLTLCVEDTAG